METAELILEEFVKVVALALEFTAVLCIAVGFVKAFILLLKRRQEHYSPMYNRFSGLSTLLTIIFCFILYSGQMWATAGSMAMLSITIFSFVMGVIAYYTGFGLKRSEKVVMSLGIGTRNIAAVLIGVLTIPNVEPNMVAMVIIWTLWTIILSYIIAPIMGRKAGKEAATVENKSEAEQTINS